MAVITFDMIVYILFKCLFCDYLNVCFVPNRIWILLNVVVLSYLNIDFQAFCKGNIASLIFMPILQRYFI